MLYNAHLSEIDKGYVVGVVMVEGRETLDSEMKWKAIKGAEWDEILE